MIRFFISFILFAILLAVPPLVLNYTDSTGWLIPKFWDIYFFFLILTLIVCISVLLARKKGPEAGSKTFLAATVVKLLMCMTFAVVYIRTAQVNSITFVLNFFCLYFLNTGFEIYSLLSNLRDQIRK